VPASDPVSTTAKNCVRKYMLSELDNYIIFRKI
jgi:hypothetical protein